MRQWGLGPTVLNLLIFFRFYYDPDFLIDVL